MRVAQIIPWRARPQEKQLGLGLSWGEHADSKSFCQVQMGGLFLAGCRILVGFFTDDRRRRDAATPHAARTSEGAAESAPRPNLQPKFDASARVVIAELAIVRGPLLAR